ncbi:MAG TPA: hypothetical protein PKA33_19840 [Amaricoccus sp.]|uniref:hypothetical protein n=1 Tax=Amaricoccus sp. TaxID=1872485 RepID=UPI002BCBF36C|nr:hypothetical protein [Amaricoccus sp.]HMR54553.1 hypothetical protein [Amaricoccus sp.]HMR61287.1 hypothetical protein [Amaricoccus sp.]HMU01586.1 hypothetical protein [Amaricoccus sp.]
MPAPLALSPLAWTAIRLGAVAALGLYASRRRGSEPKDARNEATLDEMPEGFHAHSHRAEAESAVHGRGRLRRVFRFRATGPGVEVDAAALGRLRFRRVD